MSKEERPNSPAPSFPSEDQEKLREIHVMEQALADLRSSCSLSNPLQGSEGVEQASSKSTSIITLVRVRHEP